MNKQSFIFSVLMFLSFQISAQDEFITTWEVTTDGDSITIPTNSSYTYSFQVDWGDGNVETGFTGDATHTYTTAGTYTVEISGTFPAIYFNNSGDKDKLLTIEQWGAVAWESMQNAFYGCSNLTLNATDAPDLSNVTTLNTMFRSASSMNTSIDHWDVSNITDMATMFRGASAFNQDLNSWNVSNVETMNNMFRGASIFNGNISSWNVSKVTDLSYTFAYCYDFNQPIGSWNVSNNTTLNAMFGSATSFNQDIGSWNTSKVTNIRNMFWAASAFNQDISSWDVSKVTDFYATFEDAASFNQDIGGWNVSSGESFRDMFRGASAFNQDIGNWDVSSATNLKGMFRNASTFNQDIGSWNVGNCQTFQDMFREDSVFNQDISSWDLSSATTTRDMFNRATSFDQNLGGWDMSSVTNVSYMFTYAGMSVSSYDQTLIGWSEQTLNSGLTLWAANVNYCTAETERQKIIDDFGWAINDGGKGCTSTIWNGSNWDDGEPTNSVVAIFEGDYDTYVDGEVEASDLAVKSSYTLTVRGDSSVNISGNLVNSGTIIVQDTTSFIQTSTTPSNSGTGTYTVKREGHDYHGQYNYWTSPVQNASINSTFGSTGNNFYTFDSENQAWLGADKDAVLAAGLGFIATGTSATATTITRTFSDTVGFNSGDISQSLYYSGSYHADSNWHLVGNPYPSGLDVDVFLTDNASEIESAVYLWGSDGSDYSSSSSDYAVMGLAGSVSAGGSGIAPTSATISSAQGFFVQSLANGNVTFSNSQRVSTNNTFQRVSSSDGAANRMARIWLGVEKGNGAKNELLLAFTDEAEEGKDLYDASKLSGNGFVSLYSIGDFKSEEQKLAIQGLPFFTESTIIPIGIEAKEAGEFVFSINHLDGIEEMTEVHLYDGAIGEIVNLRVGDYTVNLEQDEYNNRFELRFVEGKVTSLENNLTDLGIKFYSSQKSIKLQFTNSALTNSQIALYDISGRQIGVYSNESKQEVSIPVPQTGIYIVHVANQAGEVSKKLFVE